MMPKISVSPLATRNSSRPYCTLLRIWISHSTARVHHARLATTHSLHKKEAGTTAPAGIAREQVLGSGHPAAARRVFQRFPCDADHLVRIALDAAQVDILDRIVRLRHRPGPSRAVDLDLFQCAVQRLPVAEAALDRVEAAMEQQCGVVTLHGVDVGLDAVLLAV